jgi:hypothetical protein
MVYRSTCNLQRDAVNAFRFQPRPGDRKRDNDTSHTAVRYAMSSCTSEARGSRLSGLRQMYAMYGMHPGVAEECLRMESKSMLSGRFTSYSTLGDPL